MKLREADTITTLIMTDDWHGLDGSYDHVENDQFFVIEYNHKMKTVWLYWGDESAMWQWKGTKDSLTMAFREWLHKTINENVKVG